MCLDFCLPDRSTSWAAREALLYFELGINNRLRDADMSTRMASAK
jgi:hypothetical protein